MAKLRFVGQDITKWMIVKVDGGWTVSPPLRLEDGTPVPTWLLDGHTYQTFEEACTAFAERHENFRRVVIGE